MAAEHAAAPGDGPGPDDVDTAYAAGLEGITRAIAGLVDPADLIQVVRDMTVRVARVEWGGRPVGTGVLVAPDVLLTAGHVLGTALEPGKLPDGLEARFDFRTHYGDDRSAPHERRSAPHERGIRVPLTELLVCSPPTDRRRGRAVRRPGPHRPQLAEVDRVSSSEPIAQNVLQDGKCDEAPDPDSDPPPGRHPASRILFHLFHAAPLQHVLIHLLRG
ncbi:hypothetical protein ACW69C_30290 [Streptomyces sp. MN3]